MVILFLFRRNFPIVLQVAVSKLYCHREHSIVLFYSRPLLYLLWVYFWMTAARGYLLEGTLLSISLITNVMM